MDVRTERLRVRDVVEADLAAMVDLWCDPLVARFMGDFGPRTQAETAAWLRSTMTANAEPDRRAHNCAIVVESDPADVAGWVGFGPSSAPDAPAPYDFGYALRPVFRGHGYAREALQAMLAFCLRDLRLPSVWASCDAANSASAAAMRAAGMLAIEPDAAGDLRFRLDAQPTSE